MNNVKMYNLPVKLNQHKNVDKSHNHLQFMTQNLKAFTPVWKFQAESQRPLGFEMSNLCVAFSNKLVMFFFLNRYEERESQEKITRIAVV